MTDRLLLDTHIALWLDEGHERLSAPTRALIDDCWQRRGVLYLSAVAIWEIALLLDTGRINLHLSLDDWVGQFLDRPGSRRCRWDLARQRAAIACMVSNTVTLPTGC